MEQLDKEVVVPSNIIHSFIIMLLLMNIVNQLLFFLHITVNFHVLSKSDLVSLEHTHVNNVIDLLL